MKGFWIAAVLLLSFPAISVAEAAVKVGFVDLQRIFQQSKKGQAIVEKLQAEANQKEKEIKDLSEELRKLEADLQKQSAVLSESARKERLEAIQRKRRDVERLIEDARRDFASRQRELEIEFQKDIFSVIQEYGKEKGFTLIMERQLVIYASDGVDITKEIMERFDKKK